MLEDGHEPLAQRGTHQYAISEMKFPTWWISNLNSEITEGEHFPSLSRKKYCKISEMKFPS